jgi:predicted metalloendopeptidase
MQSNPIPPEYPNWNTFLALHTQNQERLKEILKGLQSDEGGDRSEEEAKLANFYTAAMDEEAVEAAGVTPMAPILAACERGSEVSTRAATLGELHKNFGLDNCFFRTGASPDKKDANHSICQVSQGGLGLPDRDYYFDEDKEEKRVLYVEHVARVLALVDPGTYAADGSAKAAAEAVMAMEKGLAEAHMTKTENRDPEATYNKMSIAALTEKCESKFDFGSFFTALGKTPEELGDVNVCNVVAIQKAAAVLAEVDGDTMLHYLRWHAAKEWSSYLSKAFVDARFDFYENALAGTKEQKPRWKRAMAFTESALGEALGKIYCNRFFDESSKGRATAIVETVRQALEDRLQEVAWMTADETRQAALKKMSGFKLKLGYPDVWIDYATLDIQPGQAFVAMGLAVHAFQMKRELDEMNAPTDKVKWFMTPQTINAYYHPSLNEIVFPAAILQPPFFDPDADDAVNYGAMGAIVGHEMTHGFDDQGRKYNSDGNMVDWWTETDATEYEKRVQVILYSTLLYCTILYYTILHYTTLHYTILYYTIHHALD